LRSISREGSVGERQDAGFWFLVAWCWLLIACFLLLVAGDIAGRWKLEAGSISCNIFSISD
ncbi:MAG: hypothetical protein ACOCWM_05575, partial [Cyclobacteriaceae bacterium]